MSDVKRELMKSLALVAILLFVFWMVNFQVTQASSTLVVPDQYSSISEAVNHASAGDIILVKDGVYQENVIVNKPLTLEGQGNATILGNGGVSPAAALTLSTDNIVVSGLTIQSVKSSNTTQTAYGVVVNGDGCTITRNTIQATYISIFSSAQSHTTITQNTITGSIKDGIRFLGGSQNNISDNHIIANAVSGIAVDGYSNTISRNNIENNFRGVGLGTSYSVLFGNKITANTESGIFIAGSKNIITGNDVSNNKYGVYITLQITAPSANKLYHNNFANNSYNGFDSSEALIETWDNGAEAGGNYWSDYQTRYPTAVQVGQTGTGNTPYMINTNNTDNYPLMAPYNTQNLGYAPKEIPSIQAPHDTIVASWSFNTVEASLITPDEMGNNPAVLGSETAVYNYTPAQVPGKFGQALGFNGNVYAAVHPSLSLETPNEVTIDAWVKLQEIKSGVAYNNIFIEALRTTASLPTRTLGLAINGETPENTNAPAIGALRGYVVTLNGLNEIVTLETLPFNTWVHVVFTRSTATGMHIYVNGQEQAVMVTAGSANPSGPIQRATNIYIGHDATVAIDELKISNVAEMQDQSLWMQLWLWVTIIFAGVAGSGLALYFKKQGRVRLPKQTQSALNERSPNFSSFFETIEVD